MDSFQEANNFSILTTVDQPNQIKANFSSVIDHRHDLLFRGEGRLTRNTLTRPSLITAFNLKTRTLIGRHVPLHGRFQRDHSENYMNNLEELPILRVANQCYRCKSTQAETCFWPPAPMTELYVFTISTTFFHQVKAKSVEFDS